MTFYDTLAKGPGGKAVSKKTTKELPDRVPEPKAKAEKIPTKEQPNEAIASAGDKADPKAKTEAKPVEWTVQVNAFQAEKDAKSLVKKLVDRGYDAYVVPVDIKGRTWHRVRVGRFTKREEAQELQATLQTKEKLTQARSVSR